MLYILASIDTTEDCDAVTAAVLNVRAGLLSCAREVAHDATDEGDDAPADPAPADAEPAPVATRKPRRKRTDPVADDPPQSPQPADVSHVELLDALNCIAGANGYRLSPEEAKAGGDRVMEILAGRRCIDLKAAERAAAYAAAKAWPHQGVKEAMGGGAEGMNRSDPRHRS